MRYHFGLKIWRKLVPERIREKLDLGNRLRLTDISMENTIYEMNDYFKDSEDPEIKYLLEYINRKKQINIFNGEFTEKYENPQIEEYYDEEIQLPYVLYCGKRMYLKADMRGNCASYVNSLYLEQDRESPHRYLTESFDVTPDMTIYDVGAAEGIFSLGIIERVKQVVLFECDDAWINALRATFEPYKGKVIIKKAMIGEGDDGTISLWQYCQKSRIMPNFVKMDIEGFELQASQGLRINEIPSLQKCCICLYHNANDEQNIKKLFDEKWNLEVSDSYMFMSEKPPYFRKGILRAEKML